MKIDASSMEWIRKPKSCRVTKDKVEIMTEPHNDLRSGMQELLAKEA